MGKTSIEWTETTWNPLRGCSRISPGCEHCYAEAMAARFSGPGRAFAGYADPKTKRWTRRVDLRPERLGDPLSWRTPRTVFVNSMSDLFHEDLSNGEIAAVFGVMAVAQAHTFQVLTKRAHRMREWFAWAGAMAFDRCMVHVDQRLGGDAVRAWAARGGRPAVWPLPNVWLGVSVEDQRRADERIPHLLHTPAAVRWVSYEPALGPVDFARARSHVGPSPAGRPVWPPLIDWIVVGGESGPGARPFKVRWARSVIEQCRETSTPVFVKQLGAYIVDRNDAGFDGNEDDSWDMRGDYDRIEHDLDGTRDGYQGAPVRIHLGSRKGGDMAEWPADLRVREWPKARGRAA